MADIQSAEAPAGEQAASSSSSSSTSFWAVVKDSLRGSHHDFTEGPIRRAIFLLAVPMVLEMVMESIFVVVDIFFVGRLGADAVATVGLTESLFTFVYVLAMGLSIGASAMVARRIGEKDPDKAARTAVQAIALGVLMGVPLAITGALSARPLLALMGASPWVLEHGAPFAQVMMGGMGTVMLLFLINAIFRGAGDAAISMRVLWLANALNIVLAPCFIFGLGPFPELGVTGAAVATTVGRGSGVLYQLYRLGRGGGHIQIRREHLRLEPRTMLTMLRLSSTGMFQILVSMSSWVLLVRIISSFGSAAVAGYTIAMRLVMFVMLPSWGLGNAAATLVGQSLGAKKPERGEQAVWTAGRYNMAFLGSVGVVFLLFTEPIVAAFTQDPEAAAYAVKCLRVVSCGFFFYAFGMVLTQAFNGAGDTTTPTLINLGCFWALELPLAWVLAHPVGMGPTGAFLSVTISYCLLAVVSLLLFRRGRWKLRVV